MARKTSTISKTELERFLGVVKAAGLKIFGIEMDVVAGKVRIDTSGAAGGMSADEALKEWEAKRARPS
jgi:hypothetical protein